MPATPENKPRAARSISKETAKPVLVYFPEEIVNAMDGLVIEDDTDRSKWIRKAIREALQRRGVATA